MESSNQFLGTERIGKLMQKYAIPCIISLLVGALYNIVDQIFIANASYLGSYGNAANTMLLTRHITTALPTLRFALGTSFCPRLMLTKAQQPSPIITAIARATTVRGNTTVLAALP